MLWVNVKRILRSGFFNFWRNAFVSLSSVMVMIVTLSVITSLIFVSAVFKTTLNEIRDKVDVNVYFVTTAEESEILGLQEKIESLPEVEAVTYVSREQAIQDFRKRHENDQITLQALDELGENPLGASLNIKAKDPSQYEGIAKFLNQESVLSTEKPSIVDKVNYYQNKVAIDRLSEIINTSDKMGTLIAIVAIVLSVLITLNTIRLSIYISREEISVMRLVGASKFYIRGPFVIVGMIYGIMAGIITLLLFLPITYYLGDLVAGFFVGINIFEYYTANFGQIFAIIMLSGITIGAVSSYLAVRKYLKV